MKLLTAILFCGALLWTPAGARADEASRTAKIEELMKLMNGDQMIKQVLEQMKTMQLAQFGKMDISAEDRRSALETQQRIATMLQERLSWEKLKPFYIKAYAEVFSDAEVDGMVAFYKSPTGQAMVRKMPLIMQRSMAISQQVMGDIMPEIQKITEEMGKKAKGQP